GDGSAVHNAGVRREMREDSSKNGKRHFVGTVMMQTGSNYPGQCSEPADESCTQSGKTEEALFGLGHLGSNVRRSGPWSKTVVQGEVPTSSAKPQEEDITQQSEPVVAVGKKDNPPSCDQAKSSVASFKMRVRGNTKASGSVRKASTSVVNCMTSSPSGVFGCVPQPVVSACEINAV
ncbi:unnamed protein product, partial [Pylaiella littoralis]